MVITRDIINETYELISTLIQNKCVNPPGNEIKSIKTIDRFLKSKGIASKIYKVTEKKANLVAIIKGVNVSHPGLIFGPSHVDVVPVPNSDEWEVEPFAGEIKDGFIWGRGAMDMLYIVATQIQAFCLLHEEGFRPKGDLVLLIVCDEETGSNLGTKWMIENHLEEIIDSNKEYCAISEYGGMHLSKNKIAILIAGKGVFWKRLKFQGKPGHGSIPFGVNSAIIKSVKAIEKLNRYFSSRVPFTTKYLKNLAFGLSVGFIQRLMITTKFLLPFTLKLLKKIDPETARVIHALSRMTVSCNRVQGGDKVNVIPSEAYVDLDIRTLPEQDLEYVNKHLKKALGPLYKEAEILTPEKESIAIKGNSSSIDNRFFKTIAKVTKQEFPEAQLVHVLDPGFTDLIYLRNLGINSYGYTLCDEKTTMEDFTQYQHGTNERISVKTTELTLKLYYNTAKEFLK
ncbi:MAG: M20/M25/M40 family metallo-hydrolase [Candidatus Thorarchaeota archaeon]